jgi:hypothetical protein
MQLRHTVQIPCILAALALVTTPVLGQHHHTAVSADAIQWQPGPPFLPAGAQLAVLEGDPHAKGPVTLRLKFPSGYRIAPHWHSMAEAVTVISGTFHVGAGDRLDMNATQPLQPGGFVLLPAKMRHYAWTQEETVVQVNLQGPFDIFYVNPADDPMKKGK